jgi:molybdate transport system substrate-binding protein
MSFLTKVSFLTKTSFLTKMSFLTTKRLPAMKLSAMRLSAAKLSATKPSGLAALFGLAAALAAWSAAPAGAAEITIFLNQATALTVRMMAAGFEQASGHKVNVSSLAGQELRDRIANGPGDLASLSPAELDNYMKDGKVVAGSAVEYGRVGNGVAVKTGAAKPDISTPEAFKRAMLEASSIGHTMAGTGPFNTKLFQKLGIYDQVKDKIKIIPGGTLVAAAVARGDIEIGIQQTNVIQPYAGTEYLGPLPDELMEYGRAGVGLLAVSREREAATAFIKFMTDPANTALLRKGFMEPPER